MRVYEMECFFIIGKSGIYFGIQNEINMYKSIEIPMFLNIQ